MSDLDVRIVKLEPLHVAASLGYGETPEVMSHQVLLTYAKEHGLLNGPTPPRFFGFNNPNPSEGTSQYGYEFWMTVGAEAKGDDQVQIKDAPGGLYAVTRAVGVENIFPTWQKLVAWAETSPYELLNKQCLEEHIKFVDIKLDELTLDLYLPIKE